MGLNLKTLLFALLNLSVIHGENPCPPSFCGSSTLKVQYPFKLESETPTTNCTYFNLTCNATQSKTIVNLPYAGDFYVGDINYAEGYIQLNDPGNCLMKRIMNFSLNSSPFKANYYDNYTFYVCPPDSKIFDYEKPIDCLSNSTNKTFATPEYSGDLMDGYECRRIGSWLFPVQYSGIYDVSFLFLTWDAKVCIDCQEVDDHHESRDLGSRPTATIVAVAASVPALVIMALSCCSVFFLLLMNMIGKRYEADSAAAAPNTTATPQITIATTLPLPSTTNNTGLNESKIMACTELVVLSGSDEGYIPSANDNTCSICLGNYCRKETISIISKCGHCFHANCIQQWLGKNGSCPVCRTSLSDVTL